MNERLKELRIKLNISQDEFGKKIGVKRSHVSSMESGSRRINERMIKDICREFRVSEIWIKTGEGPMFFTNTNDVLNEISYNLDLDEYDKAFFRAYKTLSEFEKKVVIDFALEIAEQIKNINKKDIEEL